MCGVGDREVSPVVEVWDGLGEGVERWLVDGWDGELGVGVVGVGDRLVAGEKWVVGGDFGAAKAAVPPSANLRFSRLARV